MYNRIVITSGISLINNSKTLLEKKYPNFHKFEEKLTEESLFLSEEVIQYLNNELIKLDKEALDKISAEISMVAILQKQKRLISNPYIILFYTDTFKGRVAGFVNQVILQAIYGSTVRIQKIYELDVNNRTILNRSLGKYLSDLTLSLQEGELKTTCFAPIGGYKIMTSLGYLVGALHSYPTAYLHENSSVIHEIPAVTVEVDESFIVENHKTLKKFLNGDCFEYDKLAEEEQSLIKEQSFMFNELEGLVELTPFGRYLCEQEKFYKFFKSKIYIETSLYDEINRRYANYWKDISRETKDLIFQYENNLGQYRGTLYHESVFSQLKNKYLNYHLFKGGNNPVFRAMWNYDIEKDSYYIAYIWFNHDDYDREAAVTMSQYKNNLDWIELTEQFYS